MTERADVAIVGAGTAGLAALREVRRRTEDFVLVSAPPWGTTCARVGCMPSKAIIAAANAFHARTRFDEFGIRGADAVSADIPAVLRRVRAVRDHFVAGVLEATQDLGPRCIEGRARLDGPNRLIVGERVVEARQVRRGLVSEARLEAHRSLHLIRTLVAMCPLLGLLGTVTGMVEVFEVMALLGNENPRAMAAGIYRATLPTMAGMVAALSALFFSVALQNQAQRTVKATAEQLGEA